MLDGVGYYTYNPAVKDDSNWPFYEDQFILLNLAMGGIAGNIPSGFDQASMLIDYVKVYQQGELNMGANLDLEDTVSVYPNPASTIINLSTTLPLSSIEVYDVFGKLLFTKEKDLTRIDVKEYTPGVYFLVITSNNQQIVKKVIVN